MKKENRNFTLDNNTTASNPGNIKIKPLVWAKNRLALVSFFTLLIPISILIALTYQKELYILTVLAVLLNVYYWISVREHFSADSNPGIVISINPTLVAVATNLSMYEGYYPALKIINYYPPNEVEIGDRVSTVSTYSGSENEHLPYWVDFHPIPINYATDDIFEIENELSRYAQEQWSEIDTLLAMLEKPYKEGLYTF